MEESSADFLYKYCDVLTCLKIIESNALYFRSPLEFNDPYDCYLDLLKFELKISRIKALLNEIDVLSNKKRKKEIQYIKKNTHEISRLRKSFIESHREGILKTGITCFSEINNNMLMWSHYSNQHKGVCLKFKNKFEQFVTLNGSGTNSVFSTFKVNYIEDFTRFDYFNDPLAITRLLTTKSMDWNYEREHRILMMDMNGIVHFNKTLLEGIIFGSRCNASDIKKIHNAISKNSISNIAFHKIALHPNSFKLALIDIDLKEFIS